MSGKYRNNTPVTNSTGSGSGGTDTGSGGSNAVVEDLWYDKQPLPLIATYSNYAGSNPDVGVYDSNFGLVSRFQQSGLGYSRPNENEIFSSHLPELSTQGLNTWNKFTTYGCKGTPMIQSDGHMILAISANGSISARDPEKIAPVIAASGTVVGPEGYRQPMSLQLIGGKMVQSVRGTPAVKDELPDVLSNNDYATISWNPNNSTIARGMCSYNANTDKLLIVEMIGNSTGDYRAHVYHNPKRKLKCQSGDLYRFVKEAKNKVNGADYVYFDFTMPNNDQNMFDASRRLRFILSNDNKIIIGRFRAGTDVSLWYVDIPDASLSTTSSAAPGSGNLAVMTGTSLGVFNSLDSKDGDYYGMRHQISWDNKWMFIYAPYYFYLTGLIGFVVNLDDPVNCFYRVTYTTYDFSINVLPFGKSGFILGIDTSSDGKKGQGYFMVDFTDPEILPTDPGNKTCFVNGKKTAFNTAIVLNYQDVGVMDTGYTGANNPALMPVDSWLK